MTKLLHNISLMFRNALLYLILLIGTILVLRRYLKINFSVLLNIGYLILNAPIFPLRWKHLHDNFK